MNNFDSKQLSIQKSEELFKRSLLVAPGGVHSPVRGFKSVGGTPRFIREASGAFLTDVDGNRYVDFCMSWGPLLFGHRDETVETAAHEAITRGWSYGTAEPYSLELAELLTQNIPWLEKVRFVNSGTEAVMSALRLARAVTGRAKVLKLDGCYHGHVDSLLVRAGSGLTDLATPDSAGISKATAAETLVAPLDDPAAIEAIFTEHPDSIAALIVEPVPANNGLLLQREGYLDQISSIAKKYGALVIFDEVITGFRLGFRGVADRVQIKPDLVCYGKVIGGGFPVGAYGGRSKWMDQIAPQGNVYQAGTLSANPVAMSAGLATIKKLLNNPPYEHLEKTTRAFTNALQEIFNQSTKDITPHRIQTEGSLFWIVAGNPEKDANGSAVVRRPNQIPAIQKESFSKLFHFLLSENIYLAPSGFEVGFLSTAHTDLEINFTLDSFRRYFLK